MEKDKLAAPSEEVLQAEQSAVTQPLVDNEDSSSLEPTEAVSESSQNQPPETETSPLKIKAEDVVKNSLELFGIKPGTRIVDYNPAAPQNVEQMLKTTYEGGSLDDARALRDDPSFRVLKIVAGQVKRDYEEKNRPQRGFLFNKKPKAPSFETSYPFLNWVTKL